MSSQIASPLTDLYGPIRADLATVEHVFDEELGSDLACVRDLVDGVRAYRGKMLRPALLLLAGQATGELNHRHHVLAAVVEMVHMATLVHDDVLDHADRRRSRPTVNAMSGNVTAVLLGDYLISHAYHLCSSLDSQEASRYIGAATNRVCEGELLQNHHCGDDQLTESQYIEIISRKTAELTATSCMLGAWASDAPADVVAAMRSYGLSAGIAFQIVDDVLDIVGQEGEVGKSLHLDADLGKATLPTIHCLAHAPREAASRLAGVLRSGLFKGNGELRTWLEETGSIEYALGEARRHVGDAIKQLELLPAGDARSSLTCLAEFIMARRF